MDHHSFLIKNAVAGLPAQAGLSGSLMGLLSNLGLGTARVARKYGGREYGGVPWRWIAGNPKGRVMDDVRRRAAMLGGGVLGAGALGSYGLYRALSGDEEKKE